MGDLTVPGNNDHDFYVETAAGAASVLVHNQDDPECELNGQFTLFGAEPYRVAVPDDPYARATLRESTKQAIRNAAPPRCRR
jgi:hypothetical protein